MLKLIATVSGFRWPKYKTVPLTRGDGTQGFTREPDGYETAEITVSVDPDALVKTIGSRALRSKKHTTKLQSGAVVLRAINIRKEG